MPDIRWLAGVRNGLAFVVTRNEMDSVYRVRTIDLVNGSSELRYEFATQVQESESETIRHALTHFQLRPNSEDIYFVRSGARYPTGRKRIRLPTTIRSIDLASIDSQMSVVLAPDEDISEILSFTWDSSGDQIVVSSGKGIDLFDSDLRRIGHFDSPLGTPLRSFTGGRLIFSGTSRDYKDPSVWSGRSTPRSHYVVRTDEIPPVSEIKG